jgi:RimJ/RimL family protein N-acetyltransferase
VERLSYRPISLDDFEPYAEFLADPVHDRAKLVGWAGFQRREITGALEVELGWLVRKEHWGKGYASEAARALHERGPERVIHLIHPENGASIAVAKKLGALHERDTEILGGPVSIYASRRSS